MNSLNRPIKVLLADDSSVLRKMLTSKLEENSRIKIVGAAKDGKEALQFYQKYRPDFTILDVLMPEMSGIEALEKIRAFDDKAKVLLYSAFTRKGAVDVMRAVTTLGAIDFIEKPAGSKEFQSFVRTLTDKILQISTAGASNASSSTAMKAPDKATEADMLVKRPYPRVPFMPKVLAIGSSTGGPQALMSVLKPLKGYCRVPIIITQHMPAAFTAILATQIADETGLEAYEAQNGQSLEKGKVYIAPGDYHMRFKISLSKEVSIVLDQGPQINFCRPAVDPMFESILQIYPTGILSVILTGMGSDGLEGARKVVETGYNLLISQDKETSAVWGMPAAVAKAGLCHEILPLDQIPHKILTILR